MPRIAVLSIIVLLSSACGEATKPELFPEGSLSFAYSGALSGTFEVVGAYPGPGVEPATFAAARPGVRAGVLGLGGFRARGEAQDALILDLRYVTGVGSYVPATGLFNYGVMNREFASAIVFDLIAGEVIVTSLDAERVRGSFTATFESVVRTWGEKPDTLQVLDGHFDLPILSERQQP